MSWPGCGRPRTRSGGPDVLPGCVAGRRARVVPGRCGREVLPALPGGHRPGLFRRVRMGVPVEGGAGFTVFGASACASENPNPSFEVAVPGSSPSPVSWLSGLSPSSPSGGPPIRCPGCRAGGGDVCARPGPPACGSGRRSWCRGRRRRRRAGRRSAARPGARPGTARPRRCCAGRGPRLSSLPVAAAGSWASGSVISTTTTLGRAIRPIRAQRRVPGGGRRGRRSPRRPSMRPHAPTVPSARAARSEREQADRCPCLRCPTPRSHPRRPSRWWGPPTRGGVWCVRAVPRVPRRCRPGRSGWFPGSGRPQVRRRR